MPDYRFDGNEWVEVGSSEGNFGSHGSADCAYIAQSVYSSANLYSDLSWFSYGRLDTPKPLAPCPACNECWDIHKHSLNRTGGGTGEDKSYSGLTLEWWNVTDADYYVVQWCKTSDFQGPTLRAAKVAHDVTTTSQYYDMMLDVDVRRGDKLIWRVMAYSADGKVSAKSAPRSVTYCADNKRPKPAKNKQNNDTGSGSAGSHPDIANCEKANFCGKITGPDNLMCCHGKQMYHLQFAFSCKDEDGSDVYELVSVQWAVTGNPTDGGDVDGGIELVSSDNQTAVVNVKGKKSQKGVIAAQVTLKDKFTNTAFNCVLRKSINVDCKTGYPSYKPWLRSYMPLIHVTHRDYVGAVVCGDSVEKTKAGATISNSMSDSSGLTSLTKLCSGTYVATGAVVQFYKSLTPLPDFDPHRPDPDECHGQEPGVTDGGGTGQVTEVVHEARVVLPMPWDCSHIDVDAVEQCIASCYGGHSDGWSYFSLTSVTGLNLYKAPGPKVCLEYYETTYNFCRTRHDLVKYEGKYGPTYYSTCVDDCCPTTPTTTTTTTSTTTTTTTCDPTDPDCTTTTTTTTSAPCGIVTILSCPTSVRENQSGSVILARTGGCEGPCCVNIALSGPGAGIVTLTSTHRCWSSGGCWNLAVGFSVGRDANCVDETFTITISLDSSDPSACCGIGGSTTCTITIDDIDSCTTTTTGAPATTTTTTTSGPGTTTTTAAPCTCAHLNCNYTSFNDGVAWDWLLDPTSKCLECSPCSCPDGTTIYPKPTGAGETPATPPSCT